MMNPNSILGAVQHYPRPHPSYLKTLFQDHSDWAFGAIAEFVDNSRDANAKTLKIAIEYMYSDIAKKEIPVLSVFDDGHGMTHEQISEMVAFGRKRPAANGLDHMGRFGIGFKTGAMRLGKDAFVLTQVANSTSIAFLSQTLNEGKDILEIPIVSYHRKGLHMKIDTSVQSETLTEHYLKAIKNFSMFDEFTIGAKCTLFDGSGTGTQIYIWNLDEVESNYCIGLDDGMSGGSSVHQGDIIIPSRRNRSRSGQMATNTRVLIDSSLRSYLAVIFKDPRMKIFVQGSQVKTRPLAKILNNTVVENGKIMGIPVQLTLGRSNLEWRHENCGMFLYWHGRLIEAYKRVGGMVDNRDKSRGLIGVIDVTGMMNDGKGGVWVNTNKQGFHDCEAYVLLEKWLGKKADDYLKNIDDRTKPKKGGYLYKPDNDWVQCDKCRKWRILSPDYDRKRLPEKWTCDMEPFNGNCKMTEVEVKHSTSNTRNTSSAMGEVGSLRKSAASQKGKGKSGV